MVRTDIDEVYKSISKTEIISESKLIEFLNSKQRDARLNQMLYPEYDGKRVSGPGRSPLIYAEPQVKEIITKYEPVEDNVKAKQLSKEGLVR